MEGGSKAQEPESDGQELERGNTQQVAARIRSATMVNPGVGM